MDAAAALRQNWRREAMGTDEARVVTTIGHGARNRAAALAAAVLAVTAAGGATAQSELERSAPTRAAASGALVPMPDISRLDCRGMAAALLRIDQAGYRDRDLVPSDHPDRPIFDYEDRLARAYYDTCLSRRNVLDDPTEVFVHGFEKR